MRWWRHLYDMGVSTPSVFKPSSIASRLRVQYLRVRARSMPLLGNPNRSHKSFIWRRILKHKGGNWKANSGFASLGTSNVILTDRFLRDFRVWCAGYVTRFRKLLRILRVCYRSVDTWPNSDNCAHSLSIVLQVCGYVTRLRQLCTLPLYATCLWVRDQTRTTVHTASMLHVCGYVTRLRQLYTLRPCYRSVGTWPDWDNCTHCVHVTGLWVLDQTRTTVHTVLGHYQIYCILY